MKSKKGDYKKTIGTWSFYIGLILAVIIAIIQKNAPAKWAIITIGILGIIVGCINVLDDDIHRFLVAAIAFIVSFAALSTLCQEVVNWAAISTFFNLLNWFIAPATAVVALKEMWEMGKD